MTNFVRRPRGRNNLRSNGRRPNNNFRNNGSGQVVSLGDSGNSNNFGRNRNNGNRNTGNILKLLEKYRNLANDALSAGDIILAESYFQHADHFVRQLPEQRPVVKNEESEEIKRSENEAEELNNDLETLSEESAEENSPTTTA
jgi:hypothetical protein